MLYSPWPCQVLCIVVVLLLVVFLSAHSSSPVFLFLFLLLATNLSFSIFTIPFLTTFEFHSFWLVFSSFLYYVFFFFPSRFLSLLVHHLFFSSSFFVCCLFNFLFYFGLTVFVERKGSTGSGSERKKHLFIAGWPLRVTEWSGLLCLWILIFNLTHLTTI